MFEFITPQMLIAIAVSFALCWLLIGRLARRIDRMEDSRDAFRKDLSEFRADLSRHQQEDCHQLTGLQESATEIRDIVVRMDESVKSIDKSLPKQFEAVHKRISGHDDKNRDHIAVVDAELKRVGQSLARLEGATGQPCTSPKKPPRKHTKK